MKSKMPFKLGALKAGTSILTEEPFVYTVKSSLQAERCDHCLKKSELQKCASCRVVFYCDRFCQKSGWAYHKMECPRLKKISPKVLPDAAKLISRIILKLEGGGANEHSFYSKHQCRSFKDLMSHYQDIKKDPSRLEHIAALSAVLEEYLGTAMLPNPVELIRIYGKMVVNTFSILDGEMHSIGIGMYLAASVVDHSCEPNAVAVFNGITLNIRTIIDLPVLDWNKVFISYIDLMRLPEERQKELQSTYYFLCQCRRCLDVEELNLMTSTICQKNSCQGIVMGGGRDGDRDCNKCGTKMSSESWEEIVEISEFSSQQLSSMKDVAYLDVCRTCLKKQEGLFAEMNLHRVKVLEMAMDSSIELGHWESALNFGRQLINPIRKYYGHNHPLTGIFFLKMGKMANLLEEVTDAKEWLKEAAATLRVTHGDEHPLVREELVSYMRQCCTR